MFLVHRPARLADLAEARDCLRDNFAYDDEGRRDLVALWTALMRDGACCAGVIEDRARSYQGRSVVWFCMKVFLTPEFARLLKGGAGPPFVGRTVLEAWRRGEKVLLDVEEARRANLGEGLNVLVLNSGAPPGFMTEQTLPALSNAVVYFTHFCLSGYRINEFLVEFYDDFTFGWGEKAGFHLRRDHAAAFADGNNGSGVTLPAGHRPPRLYGVTPAEALREGAGTVVAFIGQYERPRFFFSSAEQELLLHALLDLTDDLSNALSLATVTVKKRWLAIYDRVAAVSPEVLGAAGAGEDGRVGGASGKRGAEKRRYLLNYLRGHMEELRPLPAR